MTPAINPTADALLRAGDTKGALDALQAALKAVPDDVPARMFLFQLLCVEGLWARARIHLRALAQLSPEARMLATLYSRAIDAEAERASILLGGGRATLLAGSEAWANGLLDSLAAVGADAALLRERALADCPASPGDIDGVPFETIFDGDSRFGPMFEAIIAGQWGLIPFAAVEEITAGGPVDLRDIVWLPAQIRLRAGAGFAALLPARYPGTEQEGNPALKLGRLTEWREESGAIRGVGQRVWTTADDRDTGIFSFRRIRFAGRP